MATDQRLPMDGRGGPVLRLSTDEIEDAGAPLDALCAAVLDKFNRGIVIFDAGARVLLANAAARGFAAQGEGLCLEDGTLVLTDPEAQAALDAYLHADGGQAAMVLRVASPRSSLPYRLLVAPLEGGAANGEASAHHVLMHYAPHGRRRIPPRILAELYRLTPAEIQLVELLLQGHSLEQATLALCVSINTVKSQLHHVFEKCAVHSQAELLQLLTSGPRTL